MNTDRPPARGASAPDPARTIAIIPARNEEGHIATVVRGLLAGGIGRVRVVDNGSTDKTALRAHEAGAEVITEPVAGYGQACWTGSRDLPGDADWIFFCDADGSDDLEALPDFFEAAKDSDFVLGNRMATVEGRAVMSPAQRFGNLLAPAILWITYGHRFHDLGPMRLIRREAYEAIAMKDRGFGWTVEMQARACELGLRTKELPVRYFKRRAGVSKISGDVRGTFLAATIILSTLGKFFLARRGAAISLALLLAGALVMLPHGDFRAAGHVPVFLAGFVLMSLGYVVSAFSCWRWTGLFLTAVLVRIVLLPMEPGTDVWRYLWEGSIQWQGHNPYLVPPDAPVLESLQTAWHGKINHPDLTAGYPPPVLLLFALLAAISPSMLFFKLILTAADLVTAWVLARRFGLDRAACYALSPLVVYVFAGGAHFDSLMVLPMVLGWLAWDRGRPLVACGWLGLAIGAKYVALPLLAFAVWRLLRERRRAAAAAGLLLGLLPLAAGLAWFWVRDGIHPLAPLQMTNFARSAEFLPRVVEWIRPETATMNKIFLLPFAIGIALLVVWRRHFAKYAEDFFLLLLTVSPAVHAWYFTWALPFASATGNLAFRVGSVTAGVYFLLEHRQALGPVAWRLTGWEWIVLWVPILAAFAWSRWKNACVSRSAVPS